MWPHWQRCIISLFRCYCYTSTNLSALCFILFCVVYGPSVAWINGDSYSTHKVLFCPVWISITAFSCYWLASQPTDSTRSSQYNVHLVFGHSKYAVTECHFFALALCSGESEIQVLPPGLKISEWSSIGMHHGLLYQNFGDQKPFFPKFVWNKQTQTDCFLSIQKIHWTFLSLSDLVTWY